MAVTDLSILTEMQYHLLQPINGGVTFNPDLWTQSELLTYLNGRVRKFHYNTNLDLVISTGLSTSIGDSSYSFVTDFGLPNTITIYRVAWVRTSDGYNFELQRGDKLVSDLIDPVWAETPGTPVKYSVVTEPTLTIDIIPPPAVPGTLTIIHDEIDTAMNGTGLAFGAVDEFSPVIKWGALSDALKKDGPANDGDRAAYCEQRYLEGIELADMLIRGWA